MKRLRKLAFASAAFSVLAGAAATSQATEPAEGWIFLGRRSGGEWKPPAAAVGPSAHPLKAGDRLALRGDALYYSEADCRIVPAAEYRAGPAAPRAWMVKADGEALEIVAAPLECPSAGGARTVWAKVRIPPGRLVSVEK